MIKNKRTGKIIVNKSAHLKSIFSIGFGLMLKSRKFCIDKGFIFHLNPKIKYGITMFFVFFKIDVILLDKNKKVLDIKKNLKPWGNYIPKHRFKYMIELLPGYIKGVKVGDVLEF